MLNVREEVRPDLLIALNYYVPYVSGLTETAKVIAEGMAARGWHVCVVASRHREDLPRREEIGGVDVVRTPVVTQIGKGTISPSLPFTAARIARGAAVANVHLPMLEGGLIVRAAGRTPVVVTYHCDVELPRSFLNVAQVRLIDASSRAALRRAAVVVPSSDDYADHSRLHDAMVGHVRPIPPPSQVRPPGVATYRSSAGQHVGFLGRIVEEKGLEYLVEGFLAQAGDEDRLLIAGDYVSVAGGSVIDKVRTSARQDPRVEFLGFIPNDELADFYASLDVFALPSVNALEAFGIVQVEAMMQGIPSVASDIPGVRTPVRATGFGEIVRPRDPASIAAALTRLRNHPPERTLGTSRARALYGAERTLDAYEELFRQLREASGRFGDPP